MATATKPAVKEPETPLLQTIRNRIMIRGGPLSVADYMQEVLTNPTSGYYMSRDVFGASGDFTTSPEISQMFGEMVGIWCVLLWQALGCPRRLSLVELGPGRGTLMADLLRGTAGFKPFADALQVHLVEVSPFMRQQQWDKLQCSSNGSDAAPAASQCQPQQDEQQAELPQGASVSQGVCGLNGAPVFWHSSLDHVPAEPGCPSVFLAHEFLDALPVHQFVRDARRGWLEVMVDTAEEEEEDAAPVASSSSSTAEGIPLVRPAAATTPPLVQQQQGGSSGQQQQQQQRPDALHLRYVLSPSPTPAAQLLVPRRLEALQQQGQEGQQQAQELQAIEIGAHAMAVCETLARRIAANGGGALLIDYGRNGPYSDSLTAIRQHKGVHPLSEPGSADLSAWVDFAAMRLAAEQAHELEQQQLQPQAAGRGNRSSGAASGGGAAGRAGGGVQVFGPVPQADLLHCLGIQARLEALAQLATPAQVGSLVAGYQRLVDTAPGGMGGAYQALAITQLGLPPPVGFEAEQQQQESQGLVS